MRRELRYVAAMVLIASIAVGGAAPAVAAPATSDWLQTTAPPPSGGTLRFGQLIATTAGRVLHFRHGHNATNYFYQTSAYDPAIEGWSATQALLPQQGNEAPIALDDGRILFSGGNGNLGCITPGCAVPLTAAQAFDPATNRWTALAPMPTARLGHCAARLPDGTVLVVGGYAPVYRTGEFVTRTVRYDPRADRWTEVAPSGMTLFNCAALVLDERRVLVLGLEDRRTNAAIYDAAADRWTPLALPASLADKTVNTYPRSPFFPARLPDGQIFVVARSLTGDPTGAGVSYPATNAALFDPSTSRWSDAPAPTFSPAALTQLDDGSILATGVGAELYDPALGRWSPVAVPEVARVWTGVSPADGDAVASWSTAPLPGGRALLVAGDTALVLGDPARPRACFAETGQCLTGRFLDYWQSNGGLAANGFPLTGPLTEELEDGRTYTVQYFERVRLEHHPENPAPHDLLLGQFGRRIHPADPPAAPLPGQRYFPETGHNLGGPYRDYWEANGGLPRFGYPLSEVIAEVLEDGKEYTVQYFERARLEYHPENAAPFTILGGQFGRRILQENRWLDEEPLFKRRYLTDLKLQTALGPPRGPLVRSDLEFQSFERGAVLLPLDNALGAAYILCGGTPMAGTSAATVARGSQDPIQAVPEPEPGRYIPVGGIGDLWLRDAAVRDCLGYATIPGATGKGLAARGIFARGVLLAANTPEGAVLYAIYGEPDSLGQLAGGRYERLEVANP